MKTLNHADPQSGGPLFLDVIFFGLTSHYNTQRVSPQLLKRTTPKSTGLALTQTRRGLFASCPTRLGARAKRRTTSEPRSLAVGRMEPSAPSSLPEQSPGNGGDETEDIVIRHVIRSSYTFDDVEWGAEDANDEKETKSTKMGTPRHFVSFKPEDLGGGGRDRRAHVAGTDAHSFESRQELAAANFAMQLSKEQNVDHTFLGTISRLAFGSCRRHPDQDASSSSQAAARNTGERVSIGVAPVAGPKGLEGYAFEEDESRVHFEMRAEKSKSDKHTSRHELFLLFQAFVFVVVLGALIGGIAFSITACEGLLVEARNHVVDLGFAQGTWLAYAAFASFNTLFILIASLLTYWAPMAVTSGLPSLKAFLNGVEVPGLLAAKTLLAKVVGVTFVVATGIPLGREGPMVHAGAIVAARVTRGSRPAETSNRRPVSNLQPELSTHRPSISTPIPTLHPPNTHPSRAR